MLSLPPTVRILLAAGATDMRRQFDGLARAVREVIQSDPLSGHLFVFCNRRKDRIKILVWDRSGYWLFAKRLEKGTFAWPTPDPGASSIEMRSEELSGLLGGIDISSAKRRPWWKRDASKEEVCAATPIQS
jgi:transposase